MLYRNNYPVLEFDDAPDAKLNPSHFAGTKFDTDKLVITFFPEVIEKLLGRQAIREALGDRVCIIPSKDLSHIEHPSVVGLGDSFAGGCLPGLLGLKG